jgi:hypothetical protein
MTTLDFEKINSKKRAAHFSGSFEKFLIYKFSLCLMQSEHLTVLR